MELGRDEPPRRQSQGLVIPPGTDHTPRREAEDTGVAVVDEGHRPGAAETITNQELTATLLEHIIADVVQLHHEPDLPPLAQ